MNKIRDIALMSALFVAWTRAQPAQTANLLFGKPVVTSSNFYQNIDKTLVNDGKHDHGDWCWVSNLNAAGVNTLQIDMAASEVVKSVHITENENQS